MVVFNTRTHTHIITVTSLLLLLLLRNPSGYLGHVLLCLSKTELIRNINANIKEKENTLKKNRND